jgi:hypothetical protein
VNGLSVNAMQGALLFTFQNNLQNFKDIFKLSNFLVFVNGLDLTLYSEDIICFLKFRKISQ